MEEYTLEAIVGMIVYKALTAQQRKDATEYAGEGESFPLYANGEHLAAAWDLAGHESDKEAIRAKVRDFAERHGLTHLLPADAVKKARSADVADLFNLAWQHESDEGDHPQQTRLAHWAKQHGLEHLLPSSAHATMHDAGIVHHHDGMENDADGMHEHPVVRKAFAEVVHKALLDNGDTVIEGWVSTPQRDLQKDIVEPEAFLPVMDTYASLGMPLSSEHNTTAYPIGHGQRVAVVRDGKILKSSVHPDDEANFQYFPHTGSGVWGRYVITEAEASAAVYKGNVRGFSWIGIPIETEKLSGGGVRMTRLASWNESTIAAYPVNTGAVLAARNKRI